jgi:hypothetical protein
MVESAAGRFRAVTLDHRLNKELELQSLFGLRVHSCTHWLRHRNPPPPAPPQPTHLGSYMERYRSAKIDDISL